MKKTCVMCGREFDASRNEKLCSAECRRKRQYEKWRQYYFRNLDEQHERQRERYQRKKSGEDCERERQLALELAYWNYLLEKYPGGAG